MVENSKLTHEAREQIRKYMITLVLAPAALLGIGGIILGWFVNHAVMGSSYAKAYGEAQGEIIKLATSAATSAKEAELSSASAMRTLGALQQGEAKLVASQQIVADIVKKAEENHKTLETISAAESELASAVADSLLADPKKLSLSITGEMGTRIGRIEKELDERFKFLNSSNYIDLWAATDGVGPKLEDFSTVVPPTATAVILNVIVRSLNGGTGSFVCSGPDGAHTTSMSHYRNISVTEYSQSWSGGIVICPLTSAKTLTWGLYNNASLENTSNDVSSYGTLVGWL